MFPWCILGILPGYRVHSSYSGDLKSSIWRCEGEKGMERVFPYDCQILSGDGSWRCGLFSDQ